jgi:hypothetical protein
LPPQRQERHSSALLADSRNDALVLARLQLLLKGDRASRSAKQRYVRMTDSVPNFGR